MVSVSGGQQEEEEEEEEETGTFVKGSLTSKARAVTVELRKSDSAWAL